MLALPSTHAPAPDGAGDWATPVGAVEAMGRGGPHPALPLHVEAVAPVLARDFGADDPPPPPPGPSGPQSGASAAERAWAWEQAASHAALLRVRWDHRARARVNSLVRAFASLRLREHLLSVTADGSVALWEAGADGAARVASLSLCGGGDAAASLTSRGPTLVLAFDDPGGGGGARALVLRRGAVHVLRLHTTGAASELARARDALVASRALRWGGDQAASGPALLLLSAHSRSVQVLNQRGEGVVGVTAPPSERAISLEGAEPLGGGAVELAGRRPVAAAHLPTPEALVVAWSHGRIDIMDAASGHRSHAPLDACRGEQSAGGTYPSVRALCAERDADAPASWLVCGCDNGALAAWHVGARHCEEVARGRVHEVAVLAIASASAAAEASDGLR